MIVQIWQFRSGGSEISQFSFNVNDSNNANILAATSTDIFISLHQRLSPSLVSAVERNVREELGLTIDAS